MKPNEQVIIDFLENSPELNEDRPFVNRKRLLR